MACGLAVWDLFVKRRPRQSGTWGCRALNMQGWTRERTRGGGEKREKSSRTAASARSPGCQPQGVADDESHG
jgi:hypothetical protein